MISKKFIRDSVIYTIAGTLPMASAVILLPFYLHYLPVEEYGAMAVYTTFSMLVQVLITYSFDASVYIHYHDFKSDRTKLSQFVSSAFLLMALIGIVVSLIAIGGGSLLFDKFLANKSVSFYPYGLLSVGTSIFQAFFKVNSSLLQSQQKPVLYFWSNLLSFSLIAIFTLGGLILFPNTLVGPIGGRMVAAMISGIWALTRIFNEFGIHFNYRLLKESFNYNNTQFIYQVQQWIINNFDRFVITYYLTLQDLGEYDFAFKCFFALDFVIGGLNNSFYPKVLGFLKEQDNDKKESTVIINRYYHGLIAVVMLMVCFSILLFPLLLNLGFVKSGYQESVKYLPFLGVLYLFRGLRIYFGFPFGALKYLKPLPIIYLIVSIIKVGLMVLLIKSFNVYAVIISAVISTICEVALLRWSIRKKFIFRFNFYKIIMVPVTLSIVISIAEPTLGFRFPLVIHSIYLALGLVLLTLVYRNELKVLQWTKILK